MNEYTYNILLTYLLYYYYIYVRHEPAFSYTVLDNVQPQQELVLKNFKQRFEALSGPPDEEVPGNV